MASANQTSSARAQVAERLSSPRMHALVTAMDGYEAHVRAVVHGEGDKVPRGGCGIAQLLRRKQKRNDRSSAHAPVVAATQLTDAAQGGTWAAC